MLRWPYELDYGEGIVWQQTNMMFTDRAYGAIDGVPGIVFHYTPLYHVMTRGLSEVTGTDMLYAGRLVSIISTLLSVIVVARAAPAGSHRLWSGDYAHVLWCGSLAAPVIV